MVLSAGEWAGKPGARKPERGHDPPLTVELSLLASLSFHSLVLLRQGCSPHLASLRGGVSNDDADARKNAKAAAEHFANYGGLCEAKTQFLGQWPTVPILILPPALETGPGGISPVALRGLGRWGGGHPGAPSE